MFEPDVEGQVKGLNILPSQLAAGSAGDRGRTNERRQHAQDPTSLSQVEPVSNEQVSTSLHLHMLGKVGQVSVGVIRYSTPFMGWYRVNLDQEGDIPCCHASESSCQPFSIMPSSSLPPHTLVVVWKPHQARWGYIIGVIPRVVVDNLKFAPDWLSQGANIGFHREEYYGKKMFTLLEKWSSTSDFSSGRPLSGTALGEWSRTGPLGNGIFIDPFMAYIRTDENCGLWCHYFDRLARLSGYNLDIRSAISELNERDDEYEGMGFRGVSPYPWEVKASYRPLVPMHTVNTDESVIYGPGAYYGKHEPEVDDRMSFFRYEEFYGYLGQAYTRQVVLPPQPPPSFNHYSDTDKRFGGFREQLGLDGHWAVQTAHSVAITKRPMIPIPKRLKMVEDQKGDVGDGNETSSNYCFDGLFGSADSHKIRTIPQLQGELKNVLTAAGVLDMMAYTYNWKGFHPFHYHKKDFDSPQETDVPGVAEQHKTPKFSDLLSKTWIDRPDPVEIYIDDRDEYSTGKFWETQAGWYILPDGSMVWRDGYGAEILMTGGNIHISCPGDVFMRPGRNFNVWAGDDVVMRARNSMDLSAALKDMRFKAEQNMEMLSGNAGYGRTLIENRSLLTRHTDAGKTGEDIHATGGIHLKAKQNDIATMSRRAYIRTGNSEGEIGEGEIVLDSSKGDRPIRMVCSELDMHLQYGAYMSFPESSGKEAVYRFEANFHLIPCYTVVRGFLCNNSHFLCWGHLMAGAGHVITSISDPYVWDFKSPPRPSRSEIEQMHTDAKKLRKDAWQDIDDWWWQNPYIGNDDIQKKTEFGFRQEKQYGTKQFLIPEAYWQQWTRMGASGHVGWREPYVMYQQQKTYPYPGKVKWKDEPTMMEIDHTMWSEGQHVDEDRPGPYESPVMKWKPKKVLDGYYPAISP